MQQQLQLQDSSVRQHGLGFFSGLGRTQTRAVPLAVGGMGVAFSSHAKLPILQRLLHLLLVVPRSEGQAGIQLDAAHRTAAPT